MSLELFRLKLESKEKNRLRKKEFPDYWIHRGYLQHRAYDIAYKIFSNTISDEELSMTKTSRFSINFWLIRGYDNETSKNKVSEIQSNNSRKRYKKYSKDELSTQSTASYKYWMFRHNMTEQEAREVVSKRQSTFSLDKCIEKYGIIDGTNRWQERQDKWQNTLGLKSKEDIDCINASKDSGSMEWALRKANGDIDLASRIYDISCRGRDSGSMEWALRKANGDIDLASRIYSDRIEKIITSSNKSRKYYSKESISKLQPIYDYCQEKYPWLRIYWKDQEYGLVGHDSYYKYDFTIKELYVIIEYNGTAWHPKDGDVNWTSPFGEKYDVKFQSDLSKQKTAERNGFLYIVLWSDEPINYEFIKEIIDERINNIT